VNLLDMDAEDNNLDDEDTIMPSRSSQATVLALGNARFQPKSSASKNPELDLSINASPSGYLTSSPAVGLSTPPIKEEEKDSDFSEDGWNW